MTTPHVLVRKIQALITNQLKSATTAWRTSTESIPKAEALTHIALTIYRHPQAPPTKQLPTQRLHFDGGARGNPGTAGAGWVITTWNQQRQAWITEDYGYKYLGHTTNNVAEATAALEGITYFSTRYPFQPLMVFGDSSLILNLLSGIAQGKAPIISQLTSRTRTMLQRLPYHHRQHTKRAHNTAADYLSNIAMDTGKAHTQHGTTPHQPIDTDRLIRQTTDDSQLHPTPKATPRPRLLDFTRRLATSAPH